MAMNWKEREGKGKWLDGEGVTEVELVNKTRHQKRYQQARFLCFISYLHRQTRSSWPIVLRLVIGR